MLICLNYTHDKRNANPGKNSICDFILNYIIFVLLEQNEHVKKYSKEENRAPFLRYYPLYTLPTED